MTQTAPTPPEIEMKPSSLFNRFMHRFCWIVLVGFPVLIPFLLIMLMAKAFSAVGQVIGWVGLQALRYSYPMERGITDAFPLKVAVPANVHSATITKN